MVLSSPPPPKTNKQKPLTHSQINPNKGKYLNPRNILSLYMTTNEQIQGNSKNNKYITEVLNLKFCI